MIYEKDQSVASDVEELKVLVCSALETNEVIMKTSVAVALMFFEE
jgi:hypothetical protein